MKNKIENFTEQEKIKGMDAFRVITGGRTVTVDNIDQAHLDIGFVHAFLEMLSSIDGNRTLDELKSGTVSAMCAESLSRIEKLKAFIDSVPANSLPADILKMKASAAA